MGFFQEVNVTEGSEKWRLKKKMFYLHNKKWSDNGSKAEKNGNRGYLLHLENIFYQKGYFLEV